MVGRAWRKTLLAGQDHITREALATVVSQFMPSTQGMERELQEIAAIIECTDREFLPPPILQRLDDEGGRATLQTRLTMLKQTLKASRTKGRTHGKNKLFDERAELRRCTSVSRSWHRSPRQCGWCRGQKRN